MEKENEFELNKKNLTQKEVKTSFDEGGIFVMANWGKVSFNKSQGAWCVRGFYQGEQLYFSKYQSALGPRICQTEKEAIQLQMIISSEMANGNFNPMKYKRTKPLHLKKYTVQWIEKVRPTLK